jgi:hypothetical protein
VIPRAGTIIIITTTTEVIVSVIMAPIRGVLKGLVAIKRHHGFRAASRVSNKRRPFDDPRQGAGEGAGGGLMIDRTCHIRQLVDLLVCYVRFCGSIGQKCFT